MVQAAIVTMADRAILNDLNDPKPIFQGHAIL